ncbi:hypothetical protein [Lentzea sp. NPDC060358]|uniref:hypothetical protein n=1 Tax=Lentzea sp. NPDC060358 TaxID=3347103 RepID=UPI003662E196
MGAGAASAAEPSTFAFDAAANAFPITATSGEWTSPPATFTVSRREWDGNTLHVSVSNAGKTYVVDLSRHDGNPITTGTHTGQKALVVNRNLGCTDTSADFTVDRLDLNDQGVVTALDASVDHRCGDSPTNTLLVHVHYVRESN